MAYGTGEQDFSARIIMHMPNMYISPIIMLLLKLILRIRLTSFHKMA